MAKKHQFKVQDFKEWVNTQLKETTDSTNDEYKKGLCAALEHILSECGWDIEFTYNYWDQRGYIEWQQAGSPSGEPSIKQQYVLGPGGQEYNRNYQ